MEKLSECVSCENGKSMFCVNTTERVKAYIFSKPYILGLSHIIYCIITMTHFVGTRKINDCR